MILFLHNRYRTTGGEERVVEEMARLVREELGEPVELVGRDSLRAGRVRAAAALLAGGLPGEAVGEAVVRSGARVVHAHNLHPFFGWRALAAAKAAGAAVVLHLHQYRLVCAVGVCFTGGRECVRCHGRNTLPGVVHNCRGSRAEAVVYAAGLSLWQHRMVAEADAVIVPSSFARDRLRDLGAPLPWDRVHVLAPPVWLPVPPPATPAEGRYALVVSRLAPEKGVDVAIDACAAAGKPLVIAGDGPEMDALSRRAQGRDVRLVGPVSDGELAELRAGAAVAVVPSRSAETFGMVAAEAMAAGLPVVASAAGALPELVGERSTVPAGDVAATAAAIDRLWADAKAGEQGRMRVSAVCSPPAVAAALSGVYELACEHCQARAHASARPAPSHP